MMRSLGWLSYQAALATGMALAAPYLAVKKGAHYRATLRGRRGLDLGPADGVERLWIHAVSVGEAAVAGTLIRRLPKDIPLVVTTVTPTGQEQARRALAGRAEVAYLPFDLAGPLARFFARFRPRALVLVEGDYWPLALARMSRRGKIAVVNGRMSDRAFGRQEKIGSLNQLFYRRVDRFGLQTPEDRRRLERLGVRADRLTVTGNLKFDAAMPEPKPGLEEKILSLAAGRPILVAGSTMEGEEEQVLQALSETEQRLGKEALLILAPRHPERWNAVESLINASGHAYARRTEIDSVDGGRRQDGSRAPDSAVSVLLLDSLGDLAALYRLAQAAFIGGTLVATGGHNPLEPARFGVPTLVGGSMENFQEIAERFDREEAWWRVQDASSLAAAWVAILDDAKTAQAVGERAKDLLDANRGAVERTLQMIQPLLDTIPRLNS